MLAMEVVEHAQTEWTFTIVFVSKKNVAIRFCVDFRKLNAVTIRNSYLTRLTDECFDSLGTATMFSTLDANSTYWKV